METTSVKSYQQGINNEKQKMSGYSKAFKTSVKSLQADFKAHSKDMNAAAAALQEDGIERMAGKVAEFRADIQNQIKENQEALSHMAGNVRYLLGEINSKKKEFQSYARGQFKESIKAFWGV